MQRTADPVQRAHRMQLDPCEMWRTSVPIFQRVDPEGREWGTEVHWQKQEMVVAVLDEACATCRAVGRSLRDAAAADVGIVVVPVGDPVVARMFDSDEPTATVVIADRFGRAYAALDAHGADVVREVHEWIDFVQEQCDECGVPVDEPTEDPLADSADDGRG